MTRETMGDIDHTHPHTGRAFGENGGVFVRGPAVADGGTDDDEMRDVTHTPPDGDGANEVWERGVETSADDDESDTGDGDVEGDDTDGGISAEAVSGREDTVHE